MREPITERAAIVVRGAARRDLAAHYAWLAGQVDRDLAERFLAAADQAFARLADNPRLGPGIASHNPRLVDVRKWRVKGFPNVLIFYEPRAHGISVIRVIHAAQDWWSVLGE